MEENKWKALLLRGGAYLLALGAVLYGIYQSPYNPHLHSVEEVRLWVVSFGAWAPLMYVGVYTFRPLLMFPTLILNLSAGLLFGPWWGIFFVLVGGLGCASFCYAWGRFGGGQWFLRHFGGSLGARVQNYLGGQQSFMSMLWLRTVPIFPYDPVSVLAGSVGVPVKIYISATVLGMLPGAIAYNLLVDSVGTSSFFMALVVTLAAFGLPLWWWQRSGEGKRMGKGCVLNGKECRNRNEAGHW